MAKTKQRMAGSKEVQAAAQQLSGRPGQTQPAGAAPAGEKAKPQWSTYDAAGRGGAGFDGKDIKYLSRQGWSNNDIMRAAAYSGNVQAGADQKLRKLNTATMSAKDLPDSVLRDFRKHGGIAGALGGWNNHNYTYLGGDADDSRNYRISAKDSPADRPGYEDNIIDSLSSDQMGKWNKKNGKVLTWQGINADGTANAPTGFKTVERENGKLGEMYKDKAITWRLPQEMVDAKKQAEFDKLYGSSKAVAAKTAEATAAASNAGGLTAAPAATPAFNLSDWSVPGQSSTTASTSNSSSSSSQSDTTPSLFNQLMGSGSGSWSYGGSSGGGTGGGAPVNDYAGFLNVAEGRPADWSGDVWSSGSSSSSSSDRSRQRMSGSSDFLGALMQSRG
jgi:hypothetical protein